MDSSDITKKTPEKSLVRGLKKVVAETLMEESRFVIVAAVLKSVYRMVDFKREIRDIIGKVTAIEYDPNRNVRIGLIFYANGAKRYLLCLKASSWRHGNGR